MPTTNTLKPILWLLLVLSTPLALGEPVLRDFSGKPAEVKDYAGNGKWLLVMYWASDCHVCNAEVHRYTDFHRRHRDKDASVLGISLDGAQREEAAKLFVKQHKVDFPNLIGEPGPITLQYSDLVGEDWYGTPAFLLYDPNGRLSAMQVGAIPVELVEKFIASQHPANGATP